VGPASAEGGERDEKWVDSSMNKRRDDFKKKKAVFDFLAEEGASQLGRVVWCLIGEKKTEAGNGGTGGDGSGRPLI